MYKKLIVYDWNGTLINDTWITAACFSRVTQQWGLPPLTEETFRQAYDVPWARMYKNLGVTEEQIAQLGGHPIGDCFLDDYESRIDKAQLHEGAADILQSLARQGTDQIILSNHIDNKIERQLHRLGIASFFSTILAYRTYTAEERKTTKLDKLRHYMESKKINPSDVVIVGDTPEEIHIAKALGLTSISFTFGYASQARLEKEGPHHLARSIKDFAKVLSGGEPQGDQMKRRPDPTSNLAFEIR